MATSTHTDETLPAGHRYLDAAATAPLRPEAFEAMLNVLRSGQANASSVHSAGHRARAVIEHARAEVAQACGVRPTEVIFTSGGTEANNLAVIGLALAHSRGRHVVTSSIEHPSVLESCNYLGRVHGYEVTQVDVDQMAMVDVRRVEAALRDDTALVTIGLANGEVGSVQPVPELMAVAASNGVWCHTDAVQAAASLPASLATGAWPGANVHAMSIASHKFGGPQGAGALLVRDGIPLEPVLHGGGQERGLRSGTENVAAIAGFAAAVTAAVRDIGTRALALAASRDEFVSQVLATVPGAALTGHPTERLPGHASFVIRGVSGESMLVALDAAGIAASSGSACAAGKDEPSPVLLAMGVTAEVAQTSIRFTLHEPLTPAMRERVVTVLAREAARAAR
ncbi:MAG: cysteine desulfurase [Leucobacter sp.]|nr:cysteine desulfurase [Leucobacter sp.]